MQSIILGWLRTLVPLVVGALIAWGILPEDVSLEAEAVVWAAISSVYYLVVRLVAQKWPVFEWLLGSPRTPTYS